MNQPPDAAHRRLHGGAKLALSVIDFGMPVGAPRWLPRLSRFVEPPSSAPRLVRALP